MRYLLDVNALIALGFNEHGQHDKVAAWMERVNDSIFLTCSITELGFVRILTQSGVYGFSVRQAQALLAGLKNTPEWSFEFVVDMHDVSHLPAWVKQGSQTTDGHLLELARAHGAELATLDGRIPGAFVIS